ncbi:MAG: hypothetical protein JOZ62_17285 [Acidobacteriaceae bacterium]|nr:hypothetical protein [Acidobacteriaceae bacterium]
MKAFYAPVALLTLGFGLASTTAMPLSAAPAGYFQEYRDFDHIRDLIDRTQSDLRAAADLEHGGDKERERYRNAQRSLSTFDRHLTKGHFDKGELDKCIDDVKNILDHNTLQASSRDALHQDVEGLRMARERHDH